MLVFSTYTLYFTLSLSNKINESAINKSGGYWAGSANNGAWYSRKIDLMSEINIFGTTITSPSFFDTGLDNMQYALFQLKQSL